MSTLPLSDIVNVTVNISPTATARSGFNLGLIIGDSEVISTTDRVLLYSTLNAMLSDGFSSSDAEYVAAQLYFSQSPKPTKVAIGRWDSAAETALEAVTACRAANTDWYPCTVCGADASDILQIAAYIEAAEPVSYYFYATADDDTLNNTALSAGYETGGASPSTDISGGTATSFKIAVDGDVMDTPNYQTVVLTVTGLNTGSLIAAAMQTKIRALGGHYAAVTVTYTDSVYVITSGTTGQGSKIKVASATSNDVAASLKIGVANGATDIDGVGSLFIDLEGKEYRRTQGQYSTQADAVAAIMGYAMGANTSGANTAFTLAYKSEVGVTAESLSATQVANMKGHNGNVYINRGGSYNLYEQGVSADGSHFDEVLGVDMLSNDIQLAVMDLLSGVRKVPQTEDGVAMLVNAITGPCESAVTSGFLAPGIWNAASILTLETGNMLSKGYLILSESIASQSEQDRTLRIAPPIYVCVKEAGAIESVVIQVNVNQ